MVQLMKEDEYEKGYLYSSNTNFVGYSVFFVITDLFIENKKRL